MSGKLASPRDLFLQLLAQMLWTERMLAFEVIPKLRAQVESESLAAALGEHLAQTHDHVARVESAFLALGAEPASARDAAAAGLSQQHAELAGEIADPRLADLFHAGAAIATEQLELADYRLLLELVRELEHTEAEEALEANRSEDATALEHLQLIADHLRGELRAKAR